MGRDGWIGIGLLVFSGWLYSNLGKIPENPFVPIGPSFYPRFLLLLTMLLSLALVAQDLIARRGEKIKAKGPSENWLKHYQPTLITFFLFFLYVLLLPKLGYLLSTILFVSSLKWLLGKPAWRQLPRSLLIGIGTSLTTYMIFEKYLHVFLPRGSWLP
jgi:putative tricarboxylic transport membrane protein